MLFNENEADALPNTIRAPEPEIDSITSVRAIDHSVPNPVTVAIIDRRALGRETLTRALVSSDGRFRVRAFADIGEWERSPERSDTSLILLECGSVGNDHPSLEDELRGLIGAHRDIPVVVLGENEDPGHIAEILARGVRGYIPTSVSLNVAIGALCLAMAGGTFVPASALRNSGREQPGRQQSVHSMLGLSERQAAVAEAVALGRPNKIIAYELDLSESTVKVHIRAIMKKLQARNRTEIAFKLHAAKNGFLSSPKARPVETCAA
ncbi:response regulator transcription factor [Inquilinus sp. Marseille-Q2685]|uniref:response regulator transcription factor n=1 Tax=Inquilinus sp. Marseille-Q2685 TaxID=2866581 RepID=UPI001CE4A1E3|nr:response regulator transcription factor [Inquilinus sp. Marseille-Q2685]